MIAERLEPPRSQLMTARGDLNAQDEKLLCRPPQLFGVGFASEAAERVSKHEIGQEPKFEKYEIKDKLNRWWRGC